MLKFYPTQNFGHFWATLVTLLTFQNVSNPQHPQHPQHPKHPEHPKHPRHPRHLNTQNGHKPCFCENVAGPKNTDYCLSRSQCFSLLFYFCLSWLSSMCCFLCFLLFFVFGNSSWLSFCAPTSIVLDIVEGQGRGGAQKWPKFIMGYKHRESKGAQNRPKFNIG